MPRALLLIVLLALAAPSASGATAILPLGPGDSVHATEGPNDRDLRIEQVFGQSVAVIQTSEPAVVGIQVRHANDTLTTHILYADGQDFTGIQTTLAVIQDKLTATQARLTNLSAALDAQGISTMSAIHAAQQDVQNLTANLDDLDERLGIIQAAATESNQLVRNIEMPDLAPIQAQLEDTDATAAKLSGQLTAAILLVAFTLMGVLGPLLQTAWPHMRSRLPLPKAGDAPDDQEDDLDALLRDEQARAEALAVELVPDSPGVAGHLQSNDLREKLTPPSEEEE